MRGLAQKGMALLGAEMRHVHGGGGIIGQEAGDLAGGKRLHPLAQTQNGQGAQKAQGVDGQVRIHGAGM